MSGISLLPPDSDRPTLKTIAAETGLAIATVSRALKDASDIGEDTKKRVRETAERLGYRPNRAGVRLRTGKTNVIALVLSTEADVMNHTSKPDPLYRRDRLGRWRGLEPNPTQRPARALFGRT